MTKQTRELVVTGTAALSAGTVGSLAVGAMFSFRLGVMYVVRRDLYFRKSLCIADWQENRSRELRQTET